MTTRREEPDRNGRSSDARRRFAGLVLALLVVAAWAALGTGRLAASDPPHWLGAVETTNCTSSCHTLHQAAGGQLTAAAQNAALCQSCHNGNGLPITDAMKAIPGVSGTSHAFGVPAVNAALDTQAPLHEAMSLRVMDGNIVCSTCHNQHAAESTMGGTPRISATSKFADGGGTGTLATSGTFSGAVGLWYVIEIVDTGSATSALYRFSKDNGGSWFPTGCAVGNLGPCRTASDTATLLEDGVELTFSGGNNTLQIGDSWEFYATWPFLRAPLDQGDNAQVEKFCRDCHRSWVMDHTDLNTWDDTYKSHPVGVGLGAAGASASNRSAPLDGNGTADDGITSNNLKLDGNGNVQCLTCHAVHYADSNTASEDGP